MLQATSRVTQVLGPPCAARSGPCQHLLQLSAGLLLSQLSHSLSGAAACDGPLEGCASAERKDGGPAPQLLLHSAHDSTLMMLMAGESRQAFPVAAIVHAQALCRLQGL